MPAPLMSEDKPRAEERNPISSRKPLSAGMGGGPDSVLVLHPAAPYKVPPLGHSQILLPLFLTGCHHLLSA